MPLDPERSCLVPDHPLRMSFADISLNPLLLAQILMYVLLHVLKSVTDQDNRTGEQAKLLLCGDTAHLTPEIFAAVSSLAWYCTESELEQLDSR